MTSWNYFITGTDNSDKESRQTHFLIYSWQHLSKGQTIIDERNKWQPTKKYQFSRF